MIGGHEWSDSPGKKKYLRLLRGLATFENFNLLVYPGGTMSVSCKG